MANSLDENGLHILFEGARTCRNWHDRAIPEVLLRNLYELVSLGPTSANCQPARFKFLVSSESKIRLKPCLSVGNITKTMTAAVTVIIACDTRFFKLMTSAEPAAEFASDNPRAKTHGFRNCTLQAAYLIIAARAIGLDCGPMSGFNHTVLDNEFFPDGRLKSNFLVNLGYADTTDIPERPPRHEFSTVCEIL